MTQEAPAQALTLLPECPLCHTVTGSVTSDSLRAGATWACTRCGQIWSATRLDAVAAYSAYVASH